MIKLSDKVTDSITGIEGTAIAKCEYLNGCIQYEIQLVNLDGKTYKTEWIDEQRLTTKGKATGGGSQDIPPGMDKPN